MYEYETEKILGIIYNGQYPNIYAELVFPLGSSNSVYPRKSLAIYLYSYNSIVDKLCYIIYSKNGISAIKSGIPFSFNTIEKINSQIYIATYEIGYE